MIMEGIPTRDDISIGSSVHVICKNDQKSGKTTKGIVKKILTKSHDHPYGIKVELEDGKVGRVNKIETHNITSAVINNKTNPNESIFELLDEKIIPNTEDTQNEFKEFYQYDEDMVKIPLNMLNRNSVIDTKAKVVQKRFVIAVCAFGNSQIGGFVYIGIDAKGKIMGLDRDMKFGKFLNYNDEFANHVRDILGHYLQNRSFVVSKLKIEFTKRNDKTICIIQVSPSDDALFFTDGKLSEFYVRGPTPRAEHLTGKDMATYIMGRFQNN